MRRILLPTIVLSFALSSGAFAQTAQERATLNRDNNATNHEESVMKNDIKNHRGNVRADEKAISHDEAVKRRDSHNDAVERRNERNAERYNAERYKEKHTKKM